MTDRKLGEWFWQSFRAPGLRVVMPDLPMTRNFRWTGIYGIQIKRVFIGVLIGGADEQQPSLEAREIRRG